MTTQLLSGKRPDDLRTAAELLRAGEVVGIPTETVYGLACNAFDAQAALRVFAAKGRPADNPLIVHISDLSQLPALVREIPPAALRLAEAYWPGPMTLLMYKNPCIPDEVTAGLPTVGIRMPSHPAARAIIDAAGLPLAAPSANTSGKPSPTTARHVLDDMDGKIAAIVDGGPCSVGVESTVIDLTGEVAQVLRPGAVTEEMIRAVLGDASTDPAVNRGLRLDEKPKAPGMKYRHYAPKAPVLLLEGPPERTAARLREMLAPGDAAMVFSEYADDCPLPRRSIARMGQSFDHAAHARRVFAALRQLDQRDPVRILAQSPRTRGAEAGAVNRLRKAAGFRVVDCRGGHIVLGVTGRTGSGKSMLTSMLADRCSAVLDADRIYAELLRTDRAMLDGIAARFPGTVRDGVLDRKALGAAVFSDDAARLDLNRLTHPAVFRECAHRIGEAAPGVILLDVPLLFESGIDRLCDLTLGVTAPKALSLARIMARDGISEQAARARFDSQPNDRFYERRCDLLLHNDGGLDEFRAQIAQLFDRYLSDDPR